MPQGLDNKKIIFFITEDWYFWSHRLPIARACLKNSMDVGLVTRVNRFARKIKQAGIRLNPIYVNRSSLNPLKDLITLFSLIRIYRREKPDIVHHVALKPVIYGSWAARIAGIPRVVNAFAGLGEIAAARGIKSRIIRWLMYLSFRSFLSPRRFQIIFQNPEDRQFLLDRNMIAPGQASLIRGAGVDPDLFCPGISQPPVPTVVLAGRMLWPKGVGDFVEMARHLKSEKINVKMLLVGRPDDMNPASVPRNQMIHWKDTGLIDWLDWTNDMPAIYKNSSIAVLPSTYGEGIPKFLIEAASAGLPIVTYDMPGCREIVRNNENGFLIPLKNVAAMTRAVKRLLHDSGLRKQMGEKGREMVVNEFSQDIVVRKTLALYERILSL